MHRGILAPKYIELENRNQDAYQIIGVAGGSIKIKSALENLC